MYKAICSSFLKGGGGIINETTLKFNYFMIALELLVISPYSDDSAIFCTHKDPHIISNFVSYHFYNCVLYMTLFYRINIYLSISLALSDITVGAEVIYHVHLRSSE